jgi:streptomycin 6-kinase
MHLPRAFLENIVRIWGSHGSQWLKDLPELISFLCVEWQLSNVVVFDNLSFNFVARAYSSFYNKPVVLKVSFPCPEFLNESRALEYYNGHGCARLLELDRAKSAMLLDLIEPGVTVRSWFPAYDNNAVKVACDVIKKLHVRSITTPENFQTIDQWFSLFYTLTVPEELKKHVLKARMLVDELKQDSPELYVLHGDLHHDNILLDDNGTGIAIDPKGVIGEQAYEVGAFMCNPEELSQQSNLKAIMTSRLDLFSKLLSIDRERIAKACFVRIVLSACWTVQCKGDWRDDVRFADLILKS